MQRKFFWGNFTGKNIFFMAFFRKKIFFLRNFPQENKRENLSWVILRGTCIRCRKLKICTMIVKCRRNSCTIIEFSSIEDFFFLYDRVLQRLKNQNRNSALDTHYLNSSPFFPLLSNLFLRISISIRNFATQFFPIYYTRVRFNPREAQFQRDRRALSEENYLLI